MINVSLENETDWVVRGTVTSDVSEINLEDDEFRIELKDLLEHYIKRSHRCYRSGACAMRMRSQLSYKTFPYFLQYYAR